MLLLSYRVLCMDLIANYKLWDSTGTLLAYDYSGNTNHAEIGGSNYKTSPGYSEFSLSYWYLRSSQEESIKYLGIVYLPNGTIIELNAFSATSKLVFEIVNGTRFWDQSLIPPGNF